MSGPGPALTRTTLRLIKRHLPGLMGTAYTMTRLSRVLDLRGQESAGRWQKHSHQHQTDYDRV